MTTIDALTAGLKAAGLSAVTLELPGAGRAVVCPELGAKLLGAGVDEENALWVPGKLDAGQWCAGGQRTWLAPELGPRGYFGAGEPEWRVPPELDPGSYRPLDRRVAAAAPGSRDRCSFGAEMSLVRADGSQVRVALQREISVLPVGSRAPVPTLSIRVRNTLLNRGDRPLEREAGLWGILQVPSERQGTILVPLRSQPAAQPPARAAQSPARLYFGELPPDWLRRAPGLLYLRALAGQRYKLGVSAADGRGVVAFLRPSRTERSLWTLIVQRCAGRPSGCYLDKPPGEPEGPGDALQCYNHGDPALPFSELECHAPARRLRPGGRQSAAVDALVAKGSREKILAAAERQLGCRVDSDLLFG